MKELLSTYYDIQTAEKIVLDRKECYKNNEYYYFIMLADDKEVIHMEQAALAYYLAEQNYDHTAIPIPNIHGNWFTNYQGKNYLVVQIKRTNESNPFSHGALLANFHQTGSVYRYEPQEVSSYGKWKQLWINKLTVYEQTIEREAKANPSEYYRLLMDVIPYIIGISENAIQYVQESEQEDRFHEADQGTITFRRYEDNVLKPVIWMDELTYDHPARDLAEYVRAKLLYGGEEGVQEVVVFLSDYQSIWSLSIFGWRLLYARLIFPIHLFDIIEQGFSSKNDDMHYVELSEMLETQHRYEKRLRHFFQHVGLDHESLEVPVLHWL